MLPVYPVLMMKKLNRRHYLCLEVTRSNAEFDWTLNNFSDDRVPCPNKKLNCIREINLNLSHRDHIVCQCFHNRTQQIHQLHNIWVWTSVVYPILSLHPVWFKATIMRPWGCTLPCSSQPCTASVSLSSPGNGYLWQSPSRSWARMPKLSWVTVSPGLST